MAEQQGGQRNQGGQQGGAQGTMQSLTQGLASLLERVLNEGVYLNGDISINRLILTSVDKARSLGLVPTGSGQQGQLQSGSGQGGSGNQQSQQGQGQQQGQQVSQEEFNNLKNELNSLRQQVQSSGGQQGK